MVDGTPQGYLQKRVLRIALLVSTAMALWTSVAMAEDTASAPQEQPALRSAGNRPGASQFFGEELQEGPSGGIWQQDQLLGNMGGIRPWLGSYGISLGLTETSEILGNTSGGVREGFEYDGLTTATVQLDTQRAFNWRGGLLNVSALDVHGRNLSADNLDTLQTASGIEADDGFRLWEAWYQQSFWQNQADVKIGQQSLDQEFMVSQNALLFVNTMFGWPMIPSADMLSGGPAYPLSSPGIRLRAQPTGPWSFLAGVFDDNPSGIGPTSDQDSQRLDRNGTNFRVNDNPLMIAEIQFSRPALGDLEFVDQSILPGTYKLGMWYDAGKFADQRFGTDGLSLATGNGIARLHRGNYSIYAVADQMLWRESPQDEKSVSFFTRVMGAPGDRNLIDFSLNAGFNYREPFEHREDDVVGLGLGYAHVSNRASDLDRDTGTIAQNGETFVELTYQYAFAPWWSLQPDAQYVFNPGAGIVDPNDPSGTKRVENETVIGLRTNITF
jgi:porin